MSKYFVEVWLVETCYRRMRAVMEVEAQDAKAAEEAAYESINYSDTEGVVDEGGEPMWKEEECGGYDIDENSINVVDVRPAEGGDNG